MKAEWQFSFLVAIAIASEHGLYGSLIKEHNLELNPTALSGIDALHKTEWYTRINQAASTGSGCSSPLMNWVLGQVDQMGYDNFVYMTDEYIDLLAFEYKLFIDSNEFGEYFGSSGEHTDELIDRHESTETFWSTADASNNITTDDILLLGAHGQDLADDLKLISTLELVFTGYTNQYSPYDHAHDIQLFITSLPGGYSNPLLSGNAMAVSEASILGTIYPDSIVIGDGLLSFLDDMDLESDGPDFVHAHEFAHHLQYELGEDGDKSGLTESEESRRLELMADAFSAYFLAHDDGGDMMQHQIDELHETAFSVGDCFPSEDGHHGTPEQRMCAANWGSSEAAPEVLLDPRTLLDNFDAALNDIINLDRSTCGLNAATGVGISLMMHAIIAVVTACLLIFS